MAYNTGNAVGSTSPKDLSDNARNLDLLVLGPNYSYPDRKGVPRKSWSGMEGEHSADQVRREAEFDADQAERAVEFHEFLEHSGYEVPVDYVAGLGITRPTQTVRFGGELYRAKDASLPFTTTTWAADAAKFFSIGDAALRQNLADPAVGTSIVTNLGLLSGAVARSVRAKLGDIVSAKDYGAIGDGIIDDSVAVQALIDTLSAQGGGCIYFPRGIYRLNIVLKRYVTLVGASWGAVRGMGVFTGSITRFITTFKAAGPGFIVDTSASGGGGIGITGIDMFGLGASNPGGGVNVRAGNGNAIFRSMMFANFADEALVTDGLVGTYVDLMCTNCLLQRTRTERAGAFAFRGADNYIQNVEGNTGITGIVSTDLFLCGIYIGGANNYALNLMGELSEIGVYVKASGAVHKISNSRADLNYGPGFVGVAMFSNCHALNNSNGQPGVYSGFVSEAGSGPQYTGCRAVGAHKYGADLTGSDFTALAQRPHFSNFISDGHTLAEINYPVTNGAVVGLTGAHLRNVAAAGDISVAGGINSIQCSHGVSTEVTGFTGGHLGQVVFIKAGNSNTVLVRSSGFVVQGVDSTGKKTLVSGRPYLFMLSQTGWVEITDTNTLPVVTTATRPNSFATPGLGVIDSSLGANGKPIWRNAANTGWIDATGASV